jgi:hypothetical protein
MLNSNLFGLEIDHHRKTSFWIISFLLDEICGSYSPLLILLPLQYPSYAPKYWTPANIHFISVKAASRENDAISRGLATICRWKNQDLVILLRIPLILDPKNRSDTHRWMDKLRRIWNVDDKGFYIESICLTRIHESW